MRLLLDTHTFIWATSQPSSFGRRAKAALFDPDNDLVLSVVSIWEMAIKVGLGKLTTAGPLSELVAEQERELRLSLLEVRREHALGVQTLAQHHQDPFDRLLVSQCKIEGLVLVSADKVFDHYPIERIW